MALVAISLSDEQLDAVYDLADKYHDGNVSVMFRKALSEKYLTFEPVRKGKRGRKRQGMQETEVRQNDDKILAR